MTDFKTFKISAVTRYSTIFPLIILTEASIPSVRFVF